MLGARDEAAEFDEIDSGTSAEMFNDDPRLVVKCVMMSKVSCEMFNDDPRLVVKCLMMIQG